ncbi:MAG: threonine--tRNA ligase [Candidatus Woesearchaeota archaeon]
MGKELLLTITNLNKTIKEMPGINALDVAFKHAISFEGQDPLAVSINGQLSDLTTVLETDATLTYHFFSDEQGKEVFRHSSAHLLAHAILRLYPSAKLTIGPVVEDGFYYDIDFGEKTITPDDWKAINETMHQLAKKNIPIQRKVVSKEQALELFKDNPYKIELIQEHGDELLTVYEQDDFVDLCRGPHLPRTGLIKAIAITKVSGAYWRADAKNKQLQRIYGISFPSKDQLTEYLALLQEAEKRNHRKLGDELELFTTFDLIGKGLPIWLPKGEIMRQEIERLAIETEAKAGYVRVSTPHLAKKELFEKSGHLPYYEHSMYPAMVMDDGTYYLKAMNCPLHHLIYGMRQRSYRELPLRIAEYGTCYRNELSGTLNGLLRVRSLRMNDAHIYCTKQQIETEVAATLTMIKDYFALFGLTQFWFRLSLHDPANKEKYIDQPEHWAAAEAILKGVLERLGLPYFERKDEAAFYGPKIDVQFKNVYGREETMSTVQLDFAAKERFGLFYIDETGAKNYDVFVIHRAPLSTHERFMAFLIEHFAGKFPLWLSPEQVRILTVNQQVEAYATSVFDQCKQAGLRVHLDDRPESIPKKVREAQLAKIPLMLIIGEKEQEHKTIALRTREGNVRYDLFLETFLKYTTQAINERHLEWKMP